MSDDGRLLNALEGVVTDFFPEDLSEYRKDPDDFLKQSSFGTDTDFVGLHPVPEDVKAVMDWIAVCEFLVKFYSHFIRNKVRTSNTKDSLRDYLTRMGMNDGQATAIAQKFVDAL